jgi:hypothetical protein
MPNYGDIVRGQDIGGACPCVRFASAFHVERILCTTTSDTYICCAVDHIQRESVRYCAPPRER